MPDRRPRKPPYTIDVVLLTAAHGKLAVLLSRAPEGREKWTLPWDAPRSGEGLEVSASRLSKSIFGEDPAWKEQIGAFGDGKRHPSDHPVQHARGRYSQSPAAPRTAPDESRHRGYAAVPHAGGCGHPGRHNHVQGKTLLLLENKFAHTVVSVTDKDIKAIKGTTLNAERASISKTTKKQQD